MQYRLKILFLWHTFCQTQHLSEIFRILQNVRLRLHSLPWIAQLQHDRLMDGLLLYTCMGTALQNSEDFVQSWTGYTVSVRGVGL